MESLAVARTEYEQKTGVIAVVRPALLLHNYRSLSTVIPRLMKIIRSGITFVSRNLR